MATAIGAAVASNYYAQPLLGSMAAEFGVSYASTGIIVTVAQVSYGLGLLFLVPLGDKLEKRTLICAMTLVSACGLLISGLSPSLPILLLGTGITALFSIVTQVMVPYGAMLSAPERRGRVVGVLMSGLLMGILLGRTVAGGLAMVGGWRTVYFAAALVLAVIAVLLWRSLPPHRTQSPLPYKELLASIWHLFRTEPVLRSRSLLGALSFLVFAMFWTPLAFLLTAPPYHFSEAAIGLFGLAGAAGAMGASWSGRMADRGKTPFVTTLGLIILLGSWIPLGFAPSSLLSLIAGVVLLDLAAQLVHVSNMTAVLKLHPDKRNRLNAGYLTAYFVGGASGSFLSAFIYQDYGWSGVTAAGAFFSGLALLLGLRAFQRERTGG